MFILLGVTLYFFISCTNNSQLTSQDDDNIFLNAKSGSINLKTTPRQELETTEETTKTIPVGYYPDPVRIKRQSEAGVSSRGLSPDCLFPLLALVVSALMCFMVMMVVLCYLSNLVN